MPRTDSPLDPTLVREHLKVVKQLDRGYQPAMAAFVQITQAYPTDSPAVDAGYRSAWRMLSHVLPRSENVSSSSSPPVERARAVLAYYCQSFQQMVLDGLRRTPQWGDGRNSGKYESDTANQVAAFVQYVVGSGDTTDVDDTSGGKSYRPNAWATLYYCLRCGDAIAGLEVAATLDVPDPIRRLLLSWADAQKGGATNVWSPGQQLPRLSSTDRRAVADLLSSVKNQRYHSGVYALAAAQPLPAEEQAAVCMNSMEDFLFFGLSNAVLSSSNQNTTPVDELATLAKVVSDDFRPASFADNGESGGWNFVLLLFATQQYSEALSHLQRQGKLGLLQAAHLVLILETAGVPPINLKDVVQGTQREPEEAQAFTAALLSSYANQLLAEPTAGSTAALEYIVRIPHKARAGKEIAELIAKTGETARLVGVVDREGVRQGGAQSLNEKFSADELKKVIANAAEQLLGRDHTNRQTTGSAALCYMLAGRYASVLQLLSEMLSPPDGPDVDRAFWIEQTRSLHEHYFDKPTRASSILQQESGGPAALRTSRIMLQLNEFFDLLRSGRFHEAKQLADRLSILPTCQSDLSSKEAEYCNLNSLIKAALPSLLVGVAQTLLEQQRRLKSDAGFGNSSSSAAARERARELQERARLLVTFSGLVEMSSDKRETLSRLEAMMV